MAASSKTLIELFLIGILAPVALQAIAAGDFDTGLTGGSIIVTVFTILIPVLCGISIALKWMGKI